MRTDQRSGNQSIDFLDKIQKSRRMSGRKQREPMELALPLLQSVDFVMIEKVTVLYLGAPNVVSLRGRYSRNRVKGHSQMAPVG